MGLATNAWLTAARLRGRFYRRLDYADRRRELVRELAPGKSFVDIGGMWGIDGEIAFLAEEAGAERAALVDAMPATQRFDAERRGRESKLELHRADLHDRRAIGALGRFDVVWCTGVVYHSPSPFEQLRSLRAITGEVLVLGSQVIPELPWVEQACVWLPGISPRARAALRRAHGGQRAPRAVGLTEPFDPSPAMEHANWWWGITPSALVAMVEAAGFEVLEMHRHTPLLADLVARPVEQSADADG